MRDSTGIYFASSFTVVRPRGKTRLYIESPCGSEEILLDDLQ